MFRWWFFLVLTANLLVSGVLRSRARAEETIPRSRESKALRWIRVGLALPGLLIMTGYMISPPLVAWASVPVPRWGRWLGVALGLAVVPLNVWVLRTLGKNVSETVLTKTHHELVRAGPYRRVRHPLYTTGLVMLVALGLIAANGLLAGLAVATAALFLTVIIPREEAELIKKFGDRYTRYRRHTGRLLPRLRTSSSDPTNRA